VVVVRPECVSTPIPSQNLRLIQSTAPKLLSCKKAQPAEEPSSRCEDLGPGNVHGKDGGDHKQQQLNKSK
jgi:hypothetical protein